MDEKAMRTISRKLRPIASERIALFDNIKGILTVLVVFGHLVDHAQNANPAMSVSYDIIYLFHMPLFVLISGLFAKKVYRNGKLDVNPIISFVVLGLVFQIAITLIDGKPLTLQVFWNFPASPWYLISMAWWYLLTPILSKLEPKRGMVLSLTLSVFSGLIDLSDGFLSISRTLAFLPWFALGYYVTPETLIRLRTTAIARTAVALAALIILARVLDPTIFDWFFPMVHGRFPFMLGRVIPYALANDTSLSVATIALPLFAQGVAQKLTSLVIAGVFSLAVLRLAPTNQSWLTTLGHRTSQVYVLHRLIRSWLLYHTYFYVLLVVSQPAAGMVMAIAVTGYITALCALPLFEKPFTHLLKLRWIHPRE